MAMLMSLQKGIKITRCLEDGWISVQVRNEQDLRRVRVVHKDEWT
jgi:hypothetical protein